MALDLFTSEVLMDGLEETFVLIDDNAPGHARATAPKAFGKSQIHPLDQCRWKPSPTTLTMLEIRSGLDIPSLPRIPRRRPSNDGMVPSPQMPQEKSRWRGPAPSCVEGNDPRSVCTATIFGPNIPTAKADLDVEDRATTPPRAPQRRMSRKAPDDLQTLLSKLPAVGLDEDS